jgi:hypothetical protein
MRSSGQSRKPGEPLRNARWEAYCRARAAGKSQTEAYDLAGYRRNNRTSGQASDLENRPQIQERIRELQQEIAGKTIQTAVEVTRDGQIARLRAIADDAWKLGKHGDAIRAETEIGVLAGIRVEKSDTTVRNLGIDELDGASNDALREEQERLRAILRAEGKLTDLPIKKTA